MSARERKFSKVVIPVKRSKIKRFRWTGNGYSREIPSRIGATEMVFMRPYQRARWYDPASGRFNRLDPFSGNLSDPQSLHKYAYVHSNPVQGIDPSGLFTLGSLQVSISIGVGKIAAFTSFLGSAFTALNVLLTVWDILSIIRDVASGGPIISNARSAVDSYISTLSTNQGDVGVAALFDPDFWSESSGSFARNSPRITKTLLNRSGKLLQEILSGIKNSSDPKFPKIIFMMPHPEGIPLRKKIINVPGVKLRIGPASVSLAVQIGSAAGQSGRVLGIAIQTSRNVASQKWLFRQDFHDWHAFDPLNGAYKDFRWRDNSPGKYNFHYHVNKLK